MSEKVLNQRDFKNIRHYEIFSKYNIALTVHDFSVDEHQPLEVEIDEFGGYKHVTISSPPIMYLAAFKIDENGEISPEDGFDDPFFTVEQNGNRFGIVRSDLKFDID